DRGAEILLQVGRSTDALVVDGQQHDTAALRPADHADMIALHEGLRLQILQGGVGVLRTVAQLRLAVRAARTGLTKTARARAVDREHDITLLQQRPGPGAVMRRDAARLV